MEPAQRSMSHSQLLGAMLCIITLTLVVCCGLNWILQIPLVLAFGWPGYIARVIPQLSPDPWAVISGILCLATVTGGTHLCSLWLYAATDAQLEGTVRRRWPLKWTGKIVGLVVLMFVAGIACTGLVQQTIWIIRSPEPWTKDRNGPNPAFSRIGSAIG